MARIRSIKPEFWTSETVAEMSISTRLTFIGLWSYVDDNGVGVYNERLIGSSLYPMDDPSETSQRISLAFRELSRAGRVTLYETAGKRLFFLVSWDEHQRVDKPRKPRYQRPEDCEHTALTCENDEFAESSRGSREGPENPRKNSPRSREQGAGNKGAGSREQGETESSLRSDSGADEADARSARPRDEIWDALVEVCGIREREITKPMRGSLNGAVKELRTIGATAETIRERAGRYRRTFSGARLTPPALVKHWPALAEEPVTNGHRPYRNADHWSGNQEGSL